MHAIDLDERAAANALTNAFRNGVADRMTAATVDLFPWVPEEAYDVIVASLFQTPVDPLEQVTTHRPLDYWGRNLIDHLIGKLPEALAPGGVAYLMQLSVIGQRARPPSCWRRRGSPPASSTSPSSSSTSCSRTRSARSSASRSCPTPTT